MWTDDSNPLLAALREREEHLPDRCQGCDYVDVCRGASRLRALTATGDLWGDDPQCYLTDEETGVEDASVDGVGAD